jgi:hypothetical protein
MTPKVWIYELDGGCHTFETLHADCAAERRKLLNTFGHIQWTRVALWAEAGGAPIAVGMDCADCVMAAQGKPGYVTPTVAPAWRSA